MQGDTLAKNEHLQGTSDSESPNLSLIALLDRREQLFAERERHGARMDDSPPEPPAEKPEEHQASSMPQDILPTDIASGDAPAFAVKNRKAPIEDFVSQQMATFDTEWKALAEGKEAERLKDMEWHPDTLPQSEGHVEGTTATGEPTTLEPSRDEETLSPTPHAE
ncbi:MAG: hypothetical protein J2P37_32980, partial [Ktedonobacteraceae bacterium]|nr:hypothetical protein [Ktedonobacteraceae bacterium]